MAYTVMQACSGRVVVGVKVVWLHVLHIACGINKTIRWVCGDRHAPIVVDKEAKGVPLTWITSSFKDISCCFKVDLYVRHEVQHLFWGVEVGLNTAYYESYVDVGDLVMLVVHLEDEEYGSHPTLEGAILHRRHKCTFCDELPQVV